MRKMLLALGLAILATPVCAQSQWGYVNANLNQTHQFLDNQIRDLFQFYRANHAGTGDYMDMRYNYGVGSPYDTYNPYNSYGSYNTYGSGWHHRGRPVNVPTAVVAGGGGVAVGMVLTKLLDHPKSHESALPRPAPTAEPKSTRRVLINKTGESWKMNGQAYNVGDGHELLAGDIVRFEPVNPASTCLITQVAVSSEITELRCSH